MTDEYISRKRTVELLKSQGSRDYRREKGTLQDAIKLLYALRQRLHRRRFAERL